MPFNKSAVWASTASLLFGLSLNPLYAQHTASAKLSGEINDAVIEPAQKPNEKSSDHGFSTSDFLKPDGNTPNRSETESKVPVRLVINVPHNLDAFNQFSAYPYPMQPPRLRQTTKALPETSAALKNMLLTSGYTQRTSKEKAYPFGGWRWQYAYNAALRRSGLGVPHMISEMYAWTNDMMAYIKPECVRLNLAEKERLNRYYRYKEEYEQNRVDAETDSVRKGLFPVEVKMVRFDGRHTRNGNLRVQPGSWWLVGTHKVPGLTYYWNMPFEIEANQPKTIELTEANALLIEGGW